MALLLVFSFGLAANAQQRTPGQQAYYDGWRNRDNPGVVEERMRIAIREDPSEGLSKVPGSGSDAVGGAQGPKLDYFPHAYLGLALVKLGKKDEARKELRESLRQKAVLSDARLHKQVESYLAVLEAELAPPPTAVPTLAPPTLPPSLPTVGARPVTPTAVIVSVATRAPTTAPDASASPTPKPRDERNAVRAGIKLYFEGSYDLAEKELTPLTSQVARLFLAYTLATESLLLSNDPTRSAEAQRKMEDARRAYDAGFLSERANDPNIPRKVLEALRKR